MAITRYVGDRFAGLPSDVKPSGFSDGATFQETTAPFNLYTYITASGGWVITSSGGASSSSTVTSTGISGVGRMIVLCSAYTPSATGADTAEVPVPFGLDGVSTTIWYMRRATFRVSTTGGAPSIKIEQSTGSGAFVTMNTFTTISLNSGQYEASATGLLGIVTGGHKIRFNVLSLGTAQNWTVTAEISSL